MKKVILILNLILFISCSTLITLAPKDERNFYKNGKYYGINSITKTKYDIEGYNIYGFNEKGWNKDGINSVTNQKYDKEGYDKEGFNFSGWSKEKLNKETKTKYDVEGYDIWGFSEEGYDRKGYNKEGYDKEGYNKLGIPKNAQNNIDRNKIGIWEIKNYYNKYGEKIEKKFIQNKKKFKGTFTNRYRESGTIKANIYADNSSFGIVIYKFGFLKNFVFGENFKVKITDKNDKVYKFNFKYGRNSIMTENTNDLKVLNKLLNLESPLNIIIYSDSEMISEFYELQIKSTKGYLNALINVI